MKIVLRHIADEDRGKVKRALKQAFTDAPAVVVLDTVASRDPCSTIPVIVTNGPKDKTGRESVAGVIDTILMQKKYRFCSISFGSESVRRAEQSAPAWNWD